MDEELQQSGYQLQRGVGFVFAVIAIGAYAFSKFWIHSAGESAYWPWGLLRAEYLFLKWGGQILGVMGLIQIAILVAPKVNIQVPKFVGKICLILIIVAIILYIIFVLGVIYYISNR